ncbi:crcB [Acrasis kona]|uniref:CrcB n=1 Tax=Acrasis kona TaxID=1008807 RepID=A0AAW2Z3W7_9EUKA
MILNLASVIGHALLGALIGVAACFAIFSVQKNKDPTKKAQFIQGYMLTIVPFTTILGLLASLSWWALLIVFVIITPIGIAMVMLDSEYYKAQASSLLGDFMPSYKKTSNMY